MTTPWGMPDFDAHEEVHFVTDEKCGLRAIIAVHSTHLGPAAGGARFWHYAEDEEALTDALRLSRGMSYKNAMAGLPLGGGKSVMLADRGADQVARPAPRLRQGGRASRRTLHHRRGRRHERRRHDRGGALDASSSPACRTRPATSAAIPGRTLRSACFWASRRRSNGRSARTDLNGLHIALQGAGSVATGVALHACAEGARLSIADVDEAKAQKLAEPRRRDGRFARRNPEPRSGRAQPVRARRGPQREHDRPAQRPDRRRRRQQPARDDPKTASGCRSATSSTRRIM